MCADEPEGEIRRSPLGPYRVRGQSIGHWIYGFLGPIMTVFWMSRGKQRDRLESSLAA